MALVATVFVLAVPPPVMSRPAVRERPPSCSRACQRRVARRITRRRWRRSVRPHRAWLRATRMCESRGRYQTNTGNGFSGAYQFTLRSWRWVGGDGLPHEAEPLEQDYRAVLLLRRQGRSAWPVCG
jgi:Transglycosylase-like domain